MKKLAIVTSHPIQYNAPMFALLSKRGNVQIKVFYTWGKEVLDKKYDPGFGINIEWDIPLLKGYDYSFIENVSKKPGSNHFNGIINPTLIHDIESWKADAVLVFGWAFRSHLGVMRYFKNRIPVIFRGDSTQLDQYSFVKHIARILFLRWVYRFVDVALYVGEANKKYFIANKVPLKKLVYAPHAIDNDRFFPKEEYLQKASEMKHSIGLKGGELIFLFAAKFEKIKYPVNLIQAFQKVNHPNVHLIMIGNGTLEQEMRTVAGSDHRIHFLPFQNQSMMPVIYHLGDVFILPSNGPETWGLAVNEAMAAGKAVLVSDSCGCVANLVQHGLNGYVFQSGNMDSLEHYMQKMADNCELLSAMGKHSRLIIKEYNYTVICEAIEKVISES